MSSLTQFRSFVMPILSTYVHPVHTVGGRQETTNSGSLNCLLTSDKNVEKRGSFELSCLQLHFFEVEREINDRGLQTCIGPLGGLEFSFLFFRQGRPMRLGDLACSSPRTNKTSREGPGWETYYTPSYCRQSHLPLGGHLISVLLLFYVSVRILQLPAKRSLIIWAVYRRSQRFNELAARPSTAKDRPKGACSTTQIKSPRVSPQTMIYHSVQRALRVLYIFMQSCCRGLLLYYRLPTVS